MIIVKPLTTNMPFDINRFFGAYLQKEMRITYMFLMTVTLHVQELMFLLIAGKILCYHLNEMGITQVDVPPSFWWDYVWCCSIILQAILKDKNLAITTYTGLCSIAPMAYGFVHHLGDWMMQTNNEEGNIGHLMWKGIHLVFIMGPINISIIAVRVLYIYLVWNMNC